MSCVQSMTFLPLHGPDGVRAWALLEATDHERFGQQRYCLDSYGYARRNKRVNGRQRTIYLHREIVGLAHGDPREVDHINRGRLDNRRTNLRITDRHGNTQNVSARGASAHRGVCRNRQRRKWKACAQLHGLHHHLGYFDSEAEAAEVAQEWRRLHMPFSAADHEPEAT